MTVPAPVARVVRVAAMVVVLASCPALFVGCELFSMAALMATGGDKIKPVYTLQNRRTAIIVDDPRHRLGSPVLSGLVASAVGHHLKENEAVTAGLVPQEQVVALARELGRDYPTTPIDELGRRLGAQQVIYLEVEDVSLFAAPGAYRPTAILELKVIDAATGERLFPPASPIAGPGGGSRGRTVTVQMRHQGVTDDGRGAEAAVARALAQRIGLEVARLFYEHRPDPAFE